MKFGRIDSQVVYIEILHKSQRCDYNEEDEEEVTRALE